jgi:hypothetical protein
VYDSNQLAQREEEIKRKIANIEAAKASKLLARSRLAPALEKQGAFNLDEWMRLGEEINSAIATLDRELREANDELLEHVRLKSKQEFMYQFRADRAMQLHVLVDQILAAPMPIKQRIIGGMVKGKIIVRSHTDFDIKWEFNFPLLEAILDELPTPDGGGGGGSTSTDSSEKGMNDQEPHAGCAASMGAVRPGGQYCSLYREGQIAWRQGPRRCHRNPRHGKFQHARRSDRRGLCALAAENARIGSRGIFRLILDKALL